MHIICSSLVSLLLSLSLTGSSGRCASHSGLVFLSPAGVGACVSVGVGARVGLGVCLGVVARLCVCVHKCMSKCSRRGMGKCKSG